MIWTIFFLLEIIRINILKIKNHFIEEKIPFVKGYGNYEYRPVFIPLS